jgi:hypothetical protein
VRGRLHRERRRIVFALAVVYFLLLFLALLWPIYPVFSRIDPRVLGLPLALFYQVVMLVLSFAALLALYIFERVRGDL